MNYLTKRLLSRIKGKMAATVEKRRNIPWGVIGSRGGSTTYNELGEQWTWVKPFGRQEGLVPMLNPTALREAGTKVLFAREPRSPHRWRILSIDDSYSSETSQIPFSQFSVGVHGESHQTFDETVPGPDPVYVGQPMLMPLKTVGDGATLVVIVNEHVYTVNGAYYKSQQQGLDLTSHVPGTATKVRKVLIYLDRDQNLLKVVDGVIVDDDGITPIPEPTPPAGVDARESSWVTLANGQSTIITSTDIKDCRDFLDNGAANGVPAPDTVGDVFMYLDGGAQWATPIIAHPDDGGGWLTNEEGYLIVAG